MWCIGYMQDFSGGGWCLIELPTYAILAGPYATHQEAVEASGIRAFRLAQRWAP